MGLIGDFVMLDPMDSKNGVAKGKVRFQSCPIIAKEGAGGHLARIINWR